MNWRRETGITDQGIWEKMRGGYQRWPVNHTLPAQPQGLVFQQCFFFLLSAVNISKSQGPYVRLWYRIGWIERDTQIIGRATSFVKPLRGDSWGIFFFKLIVIYLCIMRKNPSNFIITMFKNLTWLIPISLSKIRN